MALNDVRFDIQSGGLSRLAEGKDHVSAIMFDLPAPVSYDGAKVKLYLNIESAEQDGITQEGSYAEAHYQINEFFRIRGAASLYVCMQADFSDLDQFDDIRQVGAFVSSKADIATLQNAANIADSNHRPYSIIAAWKGDTEFDAVNANDLNDLTANRVSVLIAGDGNGNGAALADTLGWNYMPALGATLGAVALAKVHESIAWPERFNLSDNYELDVIKLADGSTNPSIAITTQLHDKRYLVLQKHVGLAGTFLTDSHTAVVSTDDFAYIEANRTLDKAKRLIRSSLLPKLSSPLYVDGQTGKLSIGTIKSFEVLAMRALRPMTTALEVSDVSVYIDPEQDVLTTAVLNIIVKIVPVGVARNIVVSIGYAVNTNF